LLQQSFAKLEVVTTGVTYSVDMQHFFDIYSIKYYLM